MDGLFGLRRSIKSSLKFIYGKTQHQSWRCEHLGCRVDTKHIQRRIFILVQMFNSY